MAFIDNTDQELAALSTSFRQIGPDRWRAVSFFLPETDPVCGPGSYLLETLVLSLQLVDTLPDGVLPLTILLYAADAATGTPISSQSYTHATFPTPRNDSFIASVL